MTLEEEIEALRQIRDEALAEREAALDRLTGAKREARQAEAERDTLRNQLVQASERGSAAENARDEALAECAALRASLRKAEAGAKAREEVIYGLQREQELGWALAFMVKQWAVACEKAIEVTR